MDLASLLRYVENETGALIGVDAKHGAFFELESLRLTPDQYLHHGAYCRFVKLGGGIMGCAVNKDHSRALARHGRRFQGVCPFGVWELACPVLCQGELAAVLYMGHFQKAGTPMKAPPGKRWTGKPLPEITPAKIAELHRWATFLVKHIVLDIEIWLGSGGGRNKKRGEAFYIESSHRFIDCQFSKRIGLADLAETMRVNANYLGEILKKQHGKNFRQLLNERRVEEAKIYLQPQHALSISRVAAICGFDDSNYFSVVFKKHTGLTPSAFRELGVKRERPK
ncbi:MAG: hypothetical protein A2X49_11120 [Lentisphaerae bacterium GWF2_52_8]|nr:MAG: hypothetical protein A2X49_11120 [Lentisphaerae bacterium GWF2_52_8]